MIPDQNSKLSPTLQARLDTIRFNVTSDNHVFDDVDELLKIIDEIQEQHAREILRLELQASAEESAAGMYRGHANDLETQLNDANGELRSALQELRDARAALASAQERLDRLKPRLI